MKDFQKYEEGFSEMMDIILKVAKGGTFTGKRYDAAKTYVNVFAKANQTERAREANQLMAIHKSAKNAEEERRMILDTGIIAKPKKLKANN